MKHLMAFIVMPFDPVTLLKEPMEVGDFKESALYLQFFFFFLNRLDISKIVLAFQELSCLDSIQYVWISRDSNSVAACDFNHKACLVLSQNAF